ncbi:MAG: FAD-dependent oxidoreductase [Anaerolineales bacterium]
MDHHFLVAVIGAGPAGLYAAQYLARQGVQVVLFNRDIKPGGLVEYAIFPTKQKMRQGLEVHFNRILSMPNIHYRGNVVIGQSGDVKLDQLRRIGFQAFIVTTGAQHHKWLGLPGEDLEGVYQANDIVFHYNRLPEHAGRHFILGNQIAIIGVGNVMLDILHYLKDSREIHNVTAYARRGPSEVRFDKPTLEPVVRCFELESIKKAIEKVASHAKRVDKKVDEFYTFLERTRQHAEVCDSELRVKFKFLLSPRRLIGDENGRVQEIVFEKNHLIEEAGEILAFGTGETETFSADTVIFSIGSRVDSGFGLPLEGSHFATASRPRFPVEGISYEVYNPDLCATCEDIFVSGWARVASEGIVGLARKDAERCARAVLAYLESLSQNTNPDASDVLKRLPQLEKKLVDWDDIKKLKEAEDQIAASKGLNSYKFESNAVMLRVIEDT